MMMYFSIEFPSPLFTQRERKIACTADKIPITTNKICPTAYSRYLLNLFSVPIAIGRRRWRIWRRKRSIGWLLPHQITKNELMVLNCWKFNTKSLTPLLQSQGGIGFLSCQRPTLLALASLSKACSLE